MFFYEGDNFFTLGVGDFCSEGLIILEQVDYKQLAGGV